MVDGYYTHLSAHVHIVMLNIYWNVREIWGILAPGHDTQNKFIYLFIDIDAEKEIKSFSPAQLVGAPLRHIQTSEMMKDENCFFICRRIFFFSLFSVASQFARANYVWFGLPSAQTYTHTHTGAHDSIKKWMYAMSGTCHLIDLLLS